MQFSAHFTRLVRGQAFVFICLLIGSFLVLTGCSDAENVLKYDRAAEMERDDYREALSSRPAVDMNAMNNAAIPALQPFSATPMELDEPMPMVSISVNQTVPLRDLLFELADQAGFDIEMDPQIQGSIILTARNRPFDEVIDRIADMAGLRYKLADGLLRVQLDRPYHKNYKLDYVNVVRSLESSISLDVSVVSGDGADVGSGASIETSTEADFWTELSANIEQILTSSDNFVSLATLSNPEVQPVPPTLPLQYDAQGNPVNIDQGATLAVQFPTSPEEPALPNVPATYSVNRQSGMISAYASHRQHNELQEYLERLKASITSQVLIEAKILEVSLTDEFAAGINWGALTDSVNITGLSYFDADFALPGLTPPITAGDGFSATLAPGSDLNLVVDAINRFGTVRALSSPRLTVLNHQAAVLNVVENRVFFEFGVEIERADEAGDDDSIEIETEIRSVPEGLVISVLPSIDVETGLITMALRPTVTTVVDTVEDPTPRLAVLVSGLADGAEDLLDDLTNQVPELAVQEIDSIVKMQSGQIIVMGGLMRDRNQVSESGVPVISDVPYLGNLFKNKTDLIEKTELVIFLKATLIPGTNLHQTDRELYNKFSQDRRPFKM